VAYPLEYLEYERAAAQVSDRGARWASSGSPPYVGIVSHATDRRFVFTVQPNLALLLTAASRMAALLAPLAGGILSYAAAAECSVGQLRRGRRTG